MKKLSWDSFTKRIHIKAEVSKLFSLWVTQSGITSWFLSDAIYTRNNERVGENECIKEGDTYTWMWHNWDGKEEGKVLEIMKDKLIRFSFAGNNEVAVEFEIKENGIVLLSLTQSKIPLDEKSKLEIFYGCSNGWTFWLANLKAYVEYGILLNETKIDLRGYELSGYEFVNM